MQGMDLPSQCALLRLSHICLFLLLLPRHWLHLFLILSLSPMQCRACLSSPIDLFALQAA